MASLLVVRLADEWASFLPAGALESIRHDLDLTYARAGLLLVLLPAGGLLGNVLNVAADYVSRRVLASLGAAGYAVGLLVFAFAAPFPALAAAAFFMGMSSDGMVAGAEVALANEVGPDRLRPALARVNALSAVGDLLGPALLATTATLGLGWRPAFGFTAVALAVYAVVLAVQPFPPPVRTDVRPLAAIASVARDRRVLWLAAAGIVLGAVDEPLIGFAIAYFQQARGQAASVATLVAGATVAGGVIVYLAAGRDGARTPGRSGAVAAGAVLTAGVAGLVLAPVVPLQLVAALAVGAGAALIWLVIQHAQLTLRPGQAGTTRAVVSAIELVGVGVPALVGVIADAHGLGAGLVVFVVMAAALPLLLWRVSR